jgi:hypothetical protein
VAAWGRLAIAKRLLEGGADPTLRTKAGDTAIDIARENGKSEIVALLSEPRYAARMHTDCPAMPSGCAEAPSWAHADHGFSAARRTNGGQSSWDEAERTQRPPHGATRRVAIAHPQDFRTESARATPTRRGGHVGCRRRTRGLVCDSSRLRLAAPAAPQTVATRAQARTGTLSGALMSTQAQSSAISSTQQHSGSNHEQSVALGRPTPSPHAVVLGEGAAASTASVTALPSSRPPFASPRAS